MPTFVRDTVPRRGDLTSLRGYLERTLERVDDWTRQIDAQVQRLTRLRAISGVPTRYFWSDETDLSLPIAPGFGAGNAAAPSAMTELLISKFDTFGRDIMPTGAPLLSGGYCQYNDAAFGNVFDTYQITADATLRADGVILGVTWLEGSGGTPATDDLMDFIWWPQEVPVG